MSELKVYRFLGSDEVRADATIGNDFYLKSEVDKVIAEKDAEIESLKKQRDDLFTQGTQKAFDLVGEKLRHRATRRALWVTRAMRAEAQWNRQLRDAGIAFAIGENKSWDSWNQKQKKWQRVERKCLKKAEEYK